MNPTKSSITLTFSTILIGLIGASHLPAQSLLSESDLASAQEWISEGQDGGAARVESLEKLRELVSVYADQDEHAAIVVALLDLSAGREAILNTPLTDTLEELSNSTDAVTREAALKKLTNQIHLRMSHILSGIDAEGLDATSAELLLAITNYAVNTWNQQGSTSPKNSDGNHPQLFAVLDRVDRLADSVKNLANSSPNESLKSIRIKIAPYHSSVGSRPNLSHLHAIEIPTAVTGSILEHNLKGLNEISSVLSDLPKAMKGDEAALERMINGTKRVDAVISREEYGRAMWNAITDSAIDCVPVVRSLLTWYDTDIDPDDLNQWSQVWSTSWGDIEIASDGTATPVEGGFMDRYDGTMQVNFASRHRIVGQWQLGANPINKHGVFEWHFDHDNRLPDGSPMTFRGTRFELQPDGRGPMNWKGTRISR